jgi:colicin import membrane protein
MSAYAFETFETPNDKAISSALALVIHALFVALLIFGVNWKKPEPATMVAELWSNLPSPKSEVPPPPPAPPKVDPEPPKPQPKVEVKPVPKVEPKVEPKAEIELREKKEKERKAREQEIAEKKKRQDQEKAEAVRLAQAKEAAEAKRLAQEQADALKKLAQQQAAAHAKEVDKYKQAIAARIRRFIVEPPNLQGNPEVEFEVIQLPGGEILGVKTRKGSGQTIWDNAVERAIMRAQPLPQPPDPAMLKDVRELHLKFRPKE